MEVIVPRVLELVYTADDMRGFAEDIGYDGLPFTWDDSRRHLLWSELDAIYSLMHGLERGELEWILDAPSPSASFPALIRAVWQRRRSRGRPAPRHSRCRHTVLCQLERVAG